MTKERPVLVTTSYRGVFLGIEGLVFLSTPSDWGGGTKAKYCMGQMRTRKTSPHVEECPGGCEHTEREHIAFDRGVTAGERGFSDEGCCPYRSGRLCDAWFAGYSVGSLNREEETKKEIL